jgi:hypothetical protein
LRSTKKTTKETHKKTIEKNPKTFKTSAKNQPKTMKNPPKLVTKTFFITYPLFLIDSGTFVTNRVIQSYIYILLAVYNGLLIGCLYSTNDGLVLNNNSIYLYITKPVKIVLSHHRELLEG